MLWLCIHLRHLALDMVARGLENPRCFSITDAHGSQRWIYACDAAAAALGVRSNMTLSTAYALAPTLSVYPRNRKQEQQGLERVAAWVYGYSSQVSLAPPDTVLIEIGASHRLLGSVEQLCIAIADELSGLGHRVQLAAATTPKAARLLARAGQYHCLNSLDPLPGVLGHIDVDHFELPASVLRAFHGIGAHQLQQVLALPRDGLGRRYGQACTDYLDRLLGRRPDPLPLYQPPREFVSSIELPNEVQDSEALLFVARRLLDEFHRFLLAHDLSTTRFALLLQHSNQQQTRVLTGLSRADRDPHRLTDLVRERLSYTDLPAAVHEVALHSLELCAHQALAEDLFEAPTADSHDWSRLLERLRSRLGDQAVHGLHCSADHRPERAWSKTTTSVEKYPSNAARPLWLLDPPRKLSRQPKILLSGPERIESGWWDGADICRDYFVSEGGSGQRLWVFRDRRASNHWYLHGVFG
jgi:protein ImuB